MLGIFRNRQNFQFHPFHELINSFWPLFTSFSLLNLVLSTILFLHIFSLAKYFLYISIFLVILFMFYWFKDIAVEGTYLGNHTLIVQRGIFLGINLFILSEVLFFVSIFWAFFHSALSPNVELGLQWPPIGILSIDPFELPLLNTIILLSSGFTLTLSHFSHLKGSRLGSLIGLGFTLFLSIFFTYLQGIEYSVSSFTFTDGIYGSCFYMGTGFHGIHVIIGTIFLLVSMLRMLLYHFTNNHHIGFESSIYYWHFVDVVWIFLYISVYFWGV
jgi:cytochrome c oxidase subunit 3